MGTHAYACLQTSTPLVRQELPVRVPGPREAVVRVAGCGVCHTDLSFFTGQVKPRHSLPLVLGHEISGTVEEAGVEYRHLVGRRVIVPAVMPCGECEVCAAGYVNACPHQFMPGNDDNGGFATHVTVPARWLAPLPDSLGDYDLWELSVIADAVSTPYQAIQRSGLSSGDFAIVVGAGGIGTYGTQIAAALGARVLAVDIDDAKLDRLSAHGAAHTLNVRGMATSDARKAVRAKAQLASAPAFGWKIFEMSGTAQGQELAFGLLNSGATLGVVGFTMDTVNVRLSNLMALDARCFGNWGSSPDCYAPCIDLVLSGRVTLKPFIERHSLAHINEVFHAAHGGELRTRAILVPEES